MKKIAVLVSNPCNADARVLKMADEAKKFGYEVCIFATATKGEMSFEKKNGVYFKRIAWSPMDGMLKLLPYKLIAKLSITLSKVLAVNLMPFLKFTLFKKLFVKSIVDFKPDIIHSHDFICLPTAIEAKKQLKSVKVIYDAHELEVHRNPPLPFIRKNYVRWLEKRNARKADHVITVGDEIANILSRSFKKDVTVIYNSPQITPFVTNIRKDIGLEEGEPLIIYVGKVTIGRGVEELISLLPTLKGVHFATIGPYSAHVKQQLLARADKLGVMDRFRLLPPVPYPNVVEYIKGASLGMISVEPVTLSYELCMPNKLFELSFADVPILSNQLPEINRFLTEIGNGKCVDFEEKAHMGAEINELLYFRNKYKLSNDQGKLDKLERYSWESQMGKLKLIYDELI